MSTHTARSTLCRIIAEHEQSIAQPRRIRASEIDAGIRIIDLRERADNMDRVDRAAAMQAITPTWRETASIAAQIVLLFGAMLGLTVIALAMVR